MRKLTLVIFLILTLLSQSHVLAFEHPQENTSLSEDNKKKIDKAFIYFHNRILNLSEELKIEKIDSILLKLNSLRNKKPSYKTLLSISYLSNLLENEKGNVLSSEVSSCSRDDHDYDQASFIPIPESIFFRDKNAVYYKGYPPHCTSSGIQPKSLLILDGADPETFKILNNEYAKDKNSVYFTARGPDGLYIKNLNPVGVDIPSFTTLGNKKIYENNGIATYAKDKNNIYHGEKILSNIDASTFEVIGAYHTRTQSGVYFLDKLITGTDHESYTEDSSYPEYGRDRTHVFYKGYIIAGADPQKFSIGKCIIQDLNNTEKTVTCK